MKLLIKNIHMIDAFNNQYGSLLIKDGHIEEIFCNDIDTERDQHHTCNGEVEVIDGRGLTLMPAFVDIHCHLREPGYEYKEDLKSGQMAALKGGYTALASMANTKPVCDNKETLAMILKKSKELDLCDLYQVGAITKGLGGKELVDFNQLLPQTKLFSDDGNTIFDVEIMRKAIEASNKLGFKILVHAQPETSIIERDIALATVNGGGLHFCHVSKEASLLMIKAARESGVNISCEVTPHHLYAHGVDYKVNPSFRNAVDVKALIRGIKDGTIDMIATDHAPHSQKDKEKGAPGISSIEVAFSMVNTIFQENGLDTSTLSRLMSYEPARFLGINSGLIKKGYEANLVLVDLKEEQKINTTLFVSKGKNNPFDGAIVKGMVKMTFKRGRILFNEFSC